MTKKKYTAADFNAEISAREAYIHSLYHTALAAMPNNSREAANMTVETIRDFADRLYPITGKTDD